MNLDLDTLVGILSDHAAAEAAYQALPPALQQYVDTGDMAALETYFGGTINPMAADLAVLEQRKAKIRENGKVRKRKPEPLRDNAKAVPVPELEPPAPALPARPVLKLKRKVVE